MLPDAKEVLKRKEITFDRMTLTVETYVSKDNKAPTGTSLYHDSMDHRPLGDTIKVSGFTHNESEDLIQMFFENKKHSGGGDIHTLYPLEDGEVIITFKNPAGSVTPIAAQN